MDPYRYTYLLGYARQHNVTILFQESIESLDLTILIEKSPLATKIVIPFNDMMQQEDKDQLIMNNVYEGINTILKAYDTYISSQ